MSPLSIDSTSNRSADRAQRLKSGHRRPSGNHNVQCKIVVIPIRLDLSPGEVCWTNGCSVDVAGSSVAMMIDRAEPIAGEQLVIGATLKQARRFTTMAIQSQERLDGQLRVTATPVRDEDEDPLNERNLAPSVNAARFGFQHGLADEVLSQWESLGVLHKYLVDRVLVCPSCGSIPTWRHGCPKCGSARYRRARLIHHFACAHVDHADAFQDGDTLRCPKCRATRLIAGTDFQYIAGPISCFDCDNSGCQPTLGCMCHQCLKRFDPGDANELELHGYHVDRLDLLDFVAASE